MHSDNNHKPVASATAESFSEDSRDVTLDWLLDQDLADTDETLFTLDGEQAFDTDLTETEAAMAARPMFGSNAQADNLTGFVEEEIVLSSVGETSDIYASSPLSGPAAPQQPAPAAVVINPNVLPSSDAPAIDLEEGLDILGLAEDDDIGEKPLVIKRARKQPACVDDSTPVASEPPPLVEESTTDPVDEQTEIVKAPQVHAPFTANGSELSMSEAAELDQLISAEQTKVESAEFVELDLAVQAQGLATDASSPTVESQREIDTEPAIEDFATLNAISVEAAAVEAAAVETAPLESDIEDRGNVIDYVVSQPLPADENEFDQFLLRGEHLADIGEDLGELMVQPTE